MKTLLANGQYLEDQSPFMQQVILNQKVLTEEEEEDIIKDAIEMCNRVNSRTNERLTSTDS